MAAYSVNELNYKAVSFNENTFHSFYDEYYRKIYNYIYFKMGEPNGAEDLTCGIMEKILDNIHKYNEATSSLNTWIFTIARNQMIDYYRSKKRNETFFREDEELQLRDHVTASPDENVIEQERQQQISDLLRQLPETEREVLILKFWSGLKNIEIAEQLGMNSSNVNVMVFRSLKKLKKIMNQNNIEL